MGKGWAKGLTAATDPRIARAAAAHRGMTYAQRSVDDKRRRSTRMIVAGWSSDIAYVVGLTATDGCLIGGRRQISFKSRDRELVETYLRLLGRTDRIRQERTRVGGVAYVVQFSDVRLYRWFESVGLTPRKSLTLSAIDVPEAHLFPLVRGLLDGDGSIINKVYRADTGRTKNYYWEYLQMKFYSASRSHLEWLQARLSLATGVSGYLSEAPTRPSRHAYFHLRYGKKESLRLLPLLYPEGAPCLSRKYAIWTDYQLRHAA